MKLLGSESCLFYAVSSFPVETIKIVPLYFSHGLLSVSVWKLPLVQGS